MPQQLTDFRQTFISTIGRDTSQAELKRHVIVLDTLLAWSQARETRLSPRLTGARQDTVSYVRAGAKSVFCSLRVTRGGGATLEICPPTGYALAAEDRERVVSTLNGYSRRNPIVAGDRLCIGFGALKNAAAREAVLALMDELLARTVVGARARAELADA